VTAAPRQRPTSATSSLGANDVIRLGFGFAMAATYGIRVVSRGRSGFKVVADRPRVMPCHGRLTTPVEMSNMGECGRHIPGQGTNTLPKVRVPMFLTVLTHRHGSAFTITRHGPTAPGAVTARL
jgi:hypothetical protein